MAIGPNRGTVLAEINITPLVDVMLVLLIIVLVTAPLVQQGVNLELPEASAKPVPSQKGKVTVKVDRSRKILLDDEPVSLDGLEAAIRANPKAQKDGEVYILADKNLRYGLVLKVMAAVQRGGIRRVGLISNPIAEKETKPADGKETRGAGDPK